MKPLTYIHKYSYSLILAWKIITFYKTLCLYCFKFLFYYIQQKKQHNKGYEVAFKSTHRIPYFNEKIKEFEKQENVQLTY